MTFTDLVASIDGATPHGVGTVEVRYLTDDSRQVKPGTVFVAVKGERVDGHRFLQQAVEGGAVGLVVQASRQQEVGVIPGEGWSVSASRTIPVVCVPDTRLALGALASRFHGDPTDRLTLIGVTGTNGKTTTTYLIKAILEAASRRVGLIGTVAYQIGSEQIPASHTTPGAVELYGLFARMVQVGLDSAVMEVSSHALALDRTVGAEFDVAVFTNLTQDHLDFHTDMEDYFSAKLRLFEGLEPAGRKTAPKRAIVNADDPRGHRVCQASRVPSWTFGLKNQADLRVENLRLTLAGTTFTVASPQGRFHVDSRLVGEHNVYNALAAIGVGLHLGLSFDVIRQGLAAVANIPGRFERVDVGQPFTVVVDYAHTDDALVRLLTTAQALKTGRILTVFGCGGDRDRGKRPKMGRAAAEYSDAVFLTSDNPRTENPLAILAEVERGVKEASNAKPVQYEVIPDRRQAIDAALRAARPGDTVLIAGKGHEDYQIIGTQKHHFDDREVAREILQDLVGTP
jgi:UDP-N-acetylmuramoyl-L-alanyl-D-glutamate--2,6-diaminopimelate ligase